MKKLSLFLCIFCSVMMLSAQSRVSDLNVQTVMNHRVLNLEHSLVGQKGAQFYLVARASSDFFERKSFFYDYREHVVAVKDSVGSEQIIDSIFYDEHNNVIQIRSYQLLNGVWKYVAYINYGYDTENHLVERVNYNSFGTDNFEQGGVYDYNYSNGHLVSHEGYFGDHQTIFETCDYVYDAQGLLSGEYYLQGYGSLDSSMKVLYTYDAQGRPAINYTYVYDNGDWFLQETEEFVYDEAGNCIDHSLRDANGDYTERHLYEYDLSISASVVHMPYYIPEMNDPEAFYDANLRAIEHWYVLNDNYVLQYICDYRYEYDANPLSVDDFLVPELSLYPNPASDMLTVHCSQFTALTAEIYDIYGKLLKTVALNGSVSTISVSELPAGIYLLKMNDANGRRACQKFVKQ